MATLDITVLAKMWSSVLTQRAKAVTTLKARSTTLIVGFASNATNYCKPRETAPVRLKLSIRIMPSAFILSKCHPSANLIVA